VPVGSCLSGGLDSTTIVAFMSELLKEEAPDAASLRGQLKTFSAVFDGDPIDERRFIEVAVESTGADTTYTGPTSQQFFDELRDVVWHQEEPMVSTGPYAQWCVMRSARDQVTVLLDGQGGDELLAGYVAYQLVYLRQLWREGKRAELRREAAAARDVLAPLVRRRVAQRRKRFSIAGALRPEYRARVTDPGYGRSQDDLKLRLLQDLLQYSLPCLLRYEDKNSMAFSIESRVPYLDQELVEHILSLPADALVRDGWSRWILREGLRGTLPEKIRRRRWKVGFTTPEMRWIKARRAQFTGLYQSPSFQARPFWRGEHVVEAFRRCCEGKVEDSWFFWRAINVELWLREFCDRPSSSRRRRRGGAGGAGARRRRAARPVRLSLATRSCRAWSVIPTGPRPSASSPGTRRTRPSTSSRPERARVRAAAGEDRPRRARRRPRRALPPPGAAARAARRRRRHRREAGRREPGPLLGARRDPADAARPAAEQGRDAHAARHRARHPQTMQLAIDEAGAPRILAATAAAAAGRVVRRRGWFYAIAGPSVEAIDGPTPYTLPPHNTHAKLGPAEPDAVAAAARAGAGGGSGGRRRRPRCGRAGGRRRDRGRGRRRRRQRPRAPGCSAPRPGAPRELVRRLMLDNPLGQGHEQTPVCVLRDLGPLTQPRA
jgi:asparagine synthase (glutamine-hydrolysing)